MVFVTAAAAKSKKLGWKICAMCSRHITGWIVKITFSKILNQ